MTAAHVPELPPKEGNGPVIKLPKDLYEALRVLAIRNHRSIAGQLRYLVSEAARADLHRADR